MGNRVFWYVFQVAVAAYVIYWTDTTLPEAPHISLLAKSVIGLAIGWTLMMILSGIYGLGRRLGARLSK